MYFVALRPTDVRERCVPPELFRQRLLARGAVIQLERKISVPELTLTARTQVSGEIDLCVAEYQILLVQPRR